MDCRFSCLIFPFYANKFPISGFEKTAAYSTICSRIVSVKPVFSRKMCRFQRKKCADFKPFLRFSTDFPKTFNSVFHNLWKDGNCPKFRKFFWVSEIFPNQFSTKIRFSVSTVSTCGFLKNFCRSIFLTFPPFQQSLLLLLIFLIFLFYQNDTHRTANTIATVETFHNF